MTRGEACAGRACHAQLVLIRQQRVDQAIHGRRHAQRIGSQAAVEPLGAD